MFIPDDQLENESIPLAYLLTIWLINNDSPEMMNNELCTFPAMQKKTIRSKNLPMKY